MVGEREKIIWLQQKRAIWCHHVTKTEKENVHGQCVQVGHCLLVLAHFCHRRTFHHASSLLRT
ncbi:unnamed protein product [Ixodes hexagonus]